MSSPLLWFGNAAKFLKSQIQIPGSTSGTLTVQPAATTTSYTVTMPSAQAAGALTNDGSGNLSWTPAGGGTFIGASYYMSANESVAGNQQINYDTKIYDTNNAVTTGAAGSPGTWKFTAPSTGYYQVTHSINTAGSGYYILTKNGTGVKYLGYGGTAGGQLSQGSFTSTILLTSGDYIDIRPNGSISMSASGGTAPYFVWIDIQKLG